MIAAFALQRAIWAALDAAGLTGPVYDEVPQDASDALYTVVGETTEVPDDTHGDLGSDQTVVLHVWYRDPNEEVASGEPILAEMAAIDAALHHVTLELDGGGSMALTRSFTELMKDESEPGEVWRHGVLRYRARTLEAVS